MLGGGEKIKTDNLQSVLRIVAAAMEAKLGASDAMLVLGGETDTETLSDDWTVVTIDGAPAAHWEHTVAVTADGPRILTPRPPA